MIHENYDIEKIETELKTAVIDAGASKNVFTGNRPKVSDKMNDFIVVKVVTELKDLYAYGSAVCRIELYVKNLDDDIKNVTKVSLLMGKIRAMFPIESGVYIFDEQTIIPLGNDDFGFYATAVNINILITILKIIIMAYSSKSSIIAKGTGEISIADPVEGASLISSAVWSSIMTSLKGTCVISQEEGEKTETYIDQADAPVDVDTKAGKMTVAWTLPNTCKAMWDLLCETVSEEVMAKVYTPKAGEEVIGVKMSAKNVTRMLKIKMRKGGQTFIFPNLDWNTLFAKENEEDPASFKITTTVIAALDKTHPDYIVINQMGGTA